MPTNPTALTRRSTLFGIAGSASFVAPIVTGCANLAAKPADLQERRSEKSIEADDPAQIPLPRQPIGLSGRTIQVADGDMWFLDNGDSDEVIVLLHAFTGTALSWGHQIRAFTEAGYRVIAPSARGAGETTAPFADIDQAVEDLTILIDSVGTDRVHLIGTAYGGVKALRYAVKFPSRVKTLTLSCTPGGLSEPSYRAKQKALLSPELMALPVAIKELGPSYRYSNPEGMALWLSIEEQSASTFLDIIMTRPQDESVVSFMRALETGPNYEDLATLKMPINLIFGGADLYAPPSCARLLQAHIPDSQLTIIQEAGHSAYWEQPAKFNQSVLQFLADRT